MISKSLFNSLSLLFCLSACATSKTVVLNGEFESLPYEGQFHLESDAWVSVVQEMKDKSLRCADLNSRIQLEIIENQTHHRTAIKRTCEDDTRRIFFKTEQVLKAGRYHLVMAFKVNDPKKLSSPRVLVEYKNPNFSAGPDQSPGGARLLERNSADSGRVDASRGIQSVWYQIPAEGDQAQFGFVSDRDDDLRIRVFQFIKDSKIYRPVVTLKPQTQNTVQFGPHPLYLKVEGAPFSREINFSVFRSDLVLPQAGSSTAKARSTFYHLIDRYALSPTSSLLVIRAPETLKVNTEILVSGVMGGKAKPIGKCQVTQIRDSQATCQIDGVQLASIKKLRLESIPEQSESPGEAGKAGK